MTTASITMIWEWFHRRYQNKHVMLMLSVCIEFPNYWAIFSDVNCLFNVTKIIPRAEQEKPPLECLSHRITFHLSFVFGGWMGWGRRRVKTELWKTSGPVPIDVIWADYRLNFSIILSPTRETGIEICSRCGSPLHKLARVVLILQ